VFFVLIEALDQEVSRGLKSSPGSVPNQSPGYQCGSVQREVLFRLCTKMQWWPGDSHHDLFYAENCVLFLEPNAVSDSQLLKGLAVEGGPQSPRRPSALSLPGILDFVIPATGITGMLTNYLEHFIICLPPTALCSSVKFILSLQYIFKKI
jgi:hypothetical protein